MTNVSKIAEKLTSTWQNLLCIHRNQRGTALTEFVLTLPIFITIFGAVLMLNEVSNVAMVTELRAYGNTANKAMQLQRSNIPNSIANSELRPHLSPSAAQAKFQNLFSTDTYPPHQAVHKPAFTYIENEANYSQYQFEQSYRSFYALNTFAGVTSDQMAPIVATHPPNDMTYLRARLFGTTALGKGAREYKLWSPDGVISDGNGAMGDPLNAILPTGNPQINSLANIASSALNSLATKHAIAAGIRYGSVVGEHEEHFTASVLNFSYDLPMSSYYATTAPNYAPTGNTHATTLTTIAILRLSMENASPAYKNLLQIGSPNESGNLPHETERLPQIWNVDSDKAPRSADDLFDSTLKY